MSLQSPFRLTYFDEQGVERPYSEKYFFEESPLALSLRDMFLGTAKAVRFRLYNNLTSDEDFYSTFALKFDLSEGFTFNDQVRYDTAFDNSLRKFIKISLKMGTVGADTISQDTYELSSPFHVVIDTPIYGVLFFRDKDAYNAAVANSNLQLRYLLIPYFPDPGDFISFSIGVQIPSRFEDNFLEKALGFPTKQSHYKSPVTAPEISRSLLSLQRQYVTGGSAAHQTLATYIGPLDTALLINGAARYPYIEGMLGRLSNRGYLFSSNGYDLFSSVKQPILYSVYPLSHGFFSASTTQSYYKGLPKEINTISGQLALIPDTSTRSAKEFMLELTATLAEITTYLGAPGDQPIAEHNLYAQKLFDIISNLFVNYINNNGPAYLEYNPETGNTNTQLDSFDASLTHIWASAFSHMLNALVSALPGVFNTTAALAPSINYIEEYACILDYFETIEEVCDFTSLASKSIWAKPPSEIIGNQQSMDLFYSLYLSLAILKSIKTILLASPGLSSGQKTTLENELSYFDELLRGVGIFFSEHVFPYLHVIDETKMSGTSSDLLTDIDSVIFPVYTAAASADYILGTYSTISRQFWHLIQKIFYYRGVFTEISAMVLTHTQPANYIQDDVPAVLNDFDGIKSSILWFLSNIAEKDSEKLISLKMSVTAII